MTISAYKYCLLLAAALLVSGYAGLSGPANALSPGEPRELTDFWEMTGGGVIFFADGGATFRPEAIVRIDGLAKWMKQYPEFLVMIEGHTDNRGSRDYSFELGCRRALATREALIERGIAPERLGTFSYGKERPYALGENEAAWAQNRRVVFMVVDAIWTSNCSAAVPAR